MEQDKEKRRKEEYQRKLEEMKRKQIEEEQRKKGKNIQENLSKLWNGIMVSYALVKVFQFRDGAMKPECWD